MKPIRSPKASQHETARLPQLFSNQKRQAGLFVAVFGGGLLVFSALRGKSGNDDMDVRVSRSQTNMTDKPQVVQTGRATDATILSADTETRAGCRLRRPTPLPKFSPNINQEKPRPHRPHHSRPSVCFADATAGVAEPKSVSSIYAPFGRLISCETVVTVDSASIQTPIVGADSSPKMFITRASW